MSFKTRCTEAFYLCLIWWSILGGSGWFYRHRTHLPSPDFQSSPLLPLKPDLDFNIAYLTAGDLDSCQKHCTLESVEKKEVGTA
jgi:hypothetical protein